MEFKIIYCNYDSQYERSRATTNAFHFQAYSHNFVVAVAAPIVRNERGIKIAPPFLFHFIGLLKLYRKTAAQLSQNSYVLPYM